MTRYYNGPNGFKLPSVTTIISDCTDKSGALTQWAANQACDYIQYKVGCLRDSKSPFNSLILEECIEETIKDARTKFREVSQDALDIGSSVHDAIEMHLTTGEEPTNLQEEAENAFLAFLEWKDEHKIETHKTEHSVYGNGWAGTLDWVGIFDGKKYVIDWKTSKGIYPEYKYQIAAYRSCILDAEGCGILRIDKLTGYPEWKDTSKTYEQDLNVFNCMVSLYMARHPLIAKKAGWEKIWTLQQQDEVA